MKRIALLLAALVLVTVSFSQVKNPPRGVMANNPPRVKTRNGIVEGVRERGGILTFKGIPFAAPPVGALRWKEPQPVTPWDTVLKATAFGPRPMQAYFANFIKTADPNGSGLVQWPPISKNTVPVLHINVATRVAGEQHRDRYLWMDRAARGSK